MKYIMSLDQGTTSSRCILFDKSGNICSVVNKEFRQIFPQPGWVEHDANEIWDTTYEVAHAAMAKLNVSARDIAAIGITNQRETTVIWDKETGEPIANAIVWQCRRTSDIIDGLVAAGHADEIRAKTGLVPDAYFSGSKIKWLLDNVPGARRRAAAGKLLFGTIDTWLIWKLTGGRETKDSEIDLSVGLILHKKVGDPVERGESLGTIHARDPESAGKAAALLRSCCTFSDEPVERPAFIKAVIR